MSLTEAITALEAVPKVNIHGKGYTTVAQRGEVFRRFFPPPDWGVHTNILFVDETQVRVQALIVFHHETNGTLTVASGLAEENRKTSPINKTSAVEVCETSAIGRALAAFGLHGGEYASAGEVSNAIAQQDSPAKQLHGPRNITTLKAEMRAFAGDLQACTDVGMLEGLLNTTKDLQEQCMRDLPDWWYHEDKGAQKAIQDKRAELASDEAERAALREA